jgi:hypothetical protein
MTNVEAIDISNRDSSAEDASKEIKTLIQMGKNPSCWQQPEIYFDHFLELYSSLNDLMGEASQLVYKGLFIKLFGKPTSGEIPPFQNLSDHDQRRVTAFFLQQNVPLLPGMQKHLPITPLLATAQKRKRFLSRTKLENDYLRAAGLIYVQYLHGQNENIGITSHRGGVLIAFGDNDVGGQEWKRVDQWKNRFSYLFPANFFSWLEAIAFNLGKHPMKWAAEGARVDPYWKNIEGSEWWAAFHLSALLDSRSLQQLGQLFGDAKRPTKERQAAIQDIENCFRMLEKQWLESNHSQVS